MENTEDYQIEAETTHNLIKVDTVKSSVMGLSEESIDKNGVRYVDTKLVEDYYGVSTETVRNWIKDGKISGKQLSDRGKWFIPAEEFEFSEKRIENDDTHEKLAEILGENFDDDWEVELDEE
ncbi:helix-turn-helix domain-containing protein [Caldibacillus thermoamylovorans]|jgi:hypothetical protein|uniref:helix-turn-helix domain-containing protein n=1 Tax=Bacillaceae TaxID=186817 RepID=UPI001D0956C8|nr:helix-turn-helix domain-containing protein [Caldibacillus thermoamylovorans]MCB5935885.1 helix-turn-helix domain-containing protein [Bacillus sp. DFI.2.34]MCB7077459.1 helix-turn-helix domain-containing protein [Caldibacillus thermoamylovorans]MCM3053932.1 helix-turn-helix domain-containing protein [Caldibacillus thermoamylovorans]